MQYLIIAIEMKPDNVDAYQKRARAYRSNRVFISRDEMKGLDQDPIRAFHLYRVMLELDQRNPILYYKPGSFCQG